MSTAPLQSEVSDLFRLLDPAHQGRLIENIVNAMKPVRRDIQERQVLHFFRADPRYGEGIAIGLELDVEALRAAALNGASGAAAAG